MEKPKFKQENYEPEYIRNVLSDLGFPNSKIINVGDYFRAPAVYRKGTQASFSIHKRTGWWRDYKTGQRGHLKQLPGLFGARGAEIGIKDGDYTPRKPEIVTPDRLWEPTVLKGLLPIFDFYKKRGIEEKTLLAFKAGYTAKTDLKNRIVFPIFAPPDGSRINGFTGRDTTNKSPIKWKILGKSSKFVYPVYTVKDTYEEIQEKRSVFLIESVGDCVSMYQNGIKNTLVLFGTNISQNVINYLVSVNPINITISLNNDENKVGNEASVKVLMKLSLFFDLSKLKIKLPIKNDFGDYNKEDFAKWNDLPDQTNELLFQHLEQRKKFGLQPREERVYRQIKSLL